LSKHAEFVFLTTEPLNGAPSPALLRQSWLTPTPLFFVRNHGTVPVVNGDDYCLQIGGLTRKPLSLSLADLKRGFSRREVTATLQCAGNRRDELLALGDIPNELIWGPTAVGNATWAGAPLSEVLAAAGVMDRAAHVAFLGLDAVWQGTENVGFGGSVPLDKALMPEVLLAYEMNGDALPPEHGFPLRVILPGYIGARSVKWLASIVLQTGPSNNYFQARAYKLFPPHVTPTNVDWNAGLMLGENRLGAVICQPTPGQVISAGAVCVQGYVISSGQPAARVEVSADGGQTWCDAHFTLDAAPWAWRFWESEVHLPPGQCELVARAWDDQGECQPEQLETVWNFKGYMNNAWQRITITVPSVPSTKTGN
jgi:sulfite oxidase